LTFVVQKCTEALKSNITLKGKITEVNFFSKQEIPVAAALHMKAIIDDYNNKTCVVAFHFQNLSYAPKRIFTLLLLPGFHHVRYKR